MNKLLISYNFLPYGDVEKDVIIYLECNQTLSEMNKLKNKKHQV